MRPPRSPPPAPPPRIRRSQWRCWWRTAATVVPPPRPSRARSSTITSSARSPIASRSSATRRKRMISRVFEIVSRRIDGPLMATIALTLALGLTVVYSASGGASFDRAIGQGRNLALALFALWVFANIPPQTLMRLAPPAYIIGLALLLGVTFFGEVRNGARRWLNLGVGTIQPSEIMKIAVPLVLAWYFHRHEEALRLRDFVIAAVMLAIPVGLIVRQPDLGTALMIFASGFFVIFLAGLSWKVLLSMSAAAAASLPFIWSM